MKNTNPHVRNDYSRFGTRRIVLGIDLPDPKPCQHDHYEIEVARYADMDKTFNVILSGYGSMSIEGASAYADLLASAIDLARRLNESPEAPHGLPVKQWEAAS